MSPEIVVITAVGLGAIGLIVLLALAVKALASLMDPLEWD